MMYKLTINGGREGSVVSEHQEECKEPQAKHWYWYQARLSKYAQCYVGPAKAQPRGP